MPLACAGSIIFLCYTFTNYPDFRIAPGPTRWHTEDVVKFIKRLIIDATVVKKEHLSQTRHYHRRIWWEIDAAGLPWLYIEITPK